VALVMVTPLGDGILATLSSPEVFGLTDATSNAGRFWSGDCAAIVVARMRGARRRMMTRLMER